MHALGLNFTDPTFTNDSERCCSYIKLLDAFLFILGEEVESLPSACASMCSAPLRTDTQTAVVCVPWGQEDCQYRGSLTGI